MSRALVEAEKNTNNVMAKMLEPEQKWKFETDSAHTDICLSGFLDTGARSCVYTTGKAHTFNIIHKDDRIDLLGKKMLEYNEALALKIQLVDGYRLQLLNTTDRELALKIRSFLIKTYPDQKLYMTFQSPYLKLKIGNFIIREDAEKFRDILIESKVIPNNIYVVPEKVEQKPVEKMQIHLQMNSDCRKLDFG